MKLNTLITLILINLISAYCEEVKLSLSSKDTNETTDFVATHEWQEILPGHKVPQGLHYRINLQTGKKEAKILEPDEKTTSLQATEEDESGNIEDAKKRLEEALKNIPAEKFEDISEDRWKEITKQYRSYEQIKKELKDVDLNAKTEAEVIDQLMNEFKSNSAGKLEILRDLEYLMHSIDNSLLFISKSGIETILMPNLVNNTDVNVRVTVLKTLGAITQNNNEAKKYVSEKTNLVQIYLNLLSKYENIEELSACLYSTGSILRNNKFLPDPSINQGITILTELIANDKVPITMRTKTLVLLDDLITSSQLDLKTLLDNIKLCHHLAEFFEKNRNAFIADSDVIEKVSASFLSFNHCHPHWSEHPMFRHTILVVLNNYKARFNEESDEDLKFLYSLIVEHLENINVTLYGELKISGDDLMSKYDGKYPKDEL